MVLLNKVAMKRKSKSRSMTPSKIAKDTEGILTKDESTGTKSNKKHIIVEKKSDKDLFSISDMPDFLDKVEKMSEEELSSSSSEEESDAKAVKEKSKKLEKAANKNDKRMKKKQESNGEDDDDEHEEEDDGEDEEEGEEDSDNDEEEDSDEEIDEKLIADDDDDDDEAEDSEESSKVKKDFGQNCVLVSASDYIKTKKLAKFLIEQNLKIVDCLNLYGSVFLVTCETIEDAKALLALESQLTYNDIPLKTFKLPLFVVLQNLPNYTKSEDIQKAVSTLIDKNTFKNIVFLHINKCFIEFVTEKAFEKFTKKVTQMNISGKIVKVTSWVDKMKADYSMKCVKFSHLPKSANVEAIMKKLMENDIRPNEINQVKFFARSVCSLFFESDETEKKLLALNSVMELEKGKIFITLSTFKVILSGFSNPVTEKLVRIALKKNGINESNLHCIRVNKNHVLVELKTKEEEQKILNLNPAMEIKGDKIKITPVFIWRKNFVTVGLLKLPSRITKSQVLEAYAKEGHQFNDEDVEMEHGEKNSVLYFHDGSSDLHVKLSSVRSLKIDNMSFKVSFCQFGAQKQIGGSQRKSSKAVSNKKKKVNHKLKKQKQKKEKKEADNSI